MGKHMAVLSKAIDSSEMLCSLRFEDVKGCPYDMFTPQGIAALSIACSLMAIASLLATA